MWSGARASIKYIPGFQKQFWRNPIKPYLASCLVDPIHRQPLQVEVFDSALGEVITGNLVATDGTLYPIRNGIPRFVISEDEGQNQTSGAFSYLWKQRDTFDSPAAYASYTAWLTENYGFDSLTERAKYFSGRQRIMDLGCGRGYASSPWLNHSEWSGKGAWIGVDISEAIDVAQIKIAHISNTHFVQGDALNLPFPDSSLDTILSQGVLHHTPSTRTALLAASRALAIGGEFHFYVYRKKGAIREFTDDYIREQIASLSDEDAWTIMRSLTHIGRALSETNSSIKVDKGIPMLGIEAGKYEVQRFIYWNFAKLYWNPELEFEENVHVNFDWYRPRYAHRQTAEEVYDWCEEAKLTIQWFHQQESGFTVRAVKR